MQKRTSREVIEKTIQNTNSVGIWTFMFILLGLEIDQEKHSKELIEWLKITEAIFDYSNILPRLNTFLWASHFPDTPEIPLSWNELAVIGENLAKKEYEIIAESAFEKKVRQLPNWIGNIYQNEIIETCDF